MVLFIPAVILIFNFQWIELIILRAHCVIVRLAKGNFMNQKTQKSYFLLGVGLKKNSNFYARIVIGFTLIGC